MILITILQSPEEEEDFRVLPTDNLLAVGKAEEDYSSVEVHGKKAPITMQTGYFAGCNVMSTRI